MADLVNLRTVRKQRRRAEDRARSGEVAAPGGEGEVKLRRAEEALERRRHEGHRIVPKDSESDLT